MRLFVVASAALAGVGGCKADCNGVHLFSQTDIYCVVGPEPPPVIFNPHPRKPASIEDSFVADGEESEFFLSRRPDVDTLTVEVDAGETVLLPVVGEDVDYDLVRNSLVFSGDAPPAEAAIAVEYAPADETDR